MELIGLISIAIFGVGGVIFLAIVPWLCIGTGLKDPDQDYVD